MNILKCGCAERGVDECEDGWMHGRNRKRAQENGEQVRGKEHWMMGMSE
jgi:hypothetical protein